MSKNENKFDIQCFRCKKQYQNDGIPKRCKHCQSRNIEVKYNGSIIDFDNSLTFTWDTCEECGKFKNVKSSDASSEELENKIKELKSEDNYCEGNCQQQSTYSQAQSNSSILSNQQNSINSRERERERESNSSSKSNYLPWILGGAGILGLIGLVVYFVLKNNKKGEEK